jgi:hypothetical protein
MKTFIAISGFAFCLWLPLGAQDRVTNVSAVKVSEEGRVELREFATGQKKYAVYWISTVANTEKELWFQPFEMPPPVDIPSVTAGRDVISRLPFDLGPVLACYRSGNNLAVLIRSTDELMPIGNALLLNFTSIDTNSPDLRISWGFGVLPTGRSMNQPGAPYDYTFTSSEAFTVHYAGKFGPPIEDSVVRREPDGQFSVNGNTGNMGVFRQRINGDDPYGAPYILPSGFAVSVTVPAVAVPVPPTPPVPNSAAPAAVSPSPAESSPLKWPLLAAVVAITALALGWRFARRKGSQKGSQKGSCFRY